jgi:hypothetical protein
MRAFMTTARLDELAGVLAVVAAIASATADAQVPTPVPEPASPASEPSTVPPPAPPVELPPGAPEAPAAPEPVPPTPPLAPAPAEPPALPPPDPLPVVTPVPPLPAPEPSDAQSANASYRPGRGFTLQTQDERFSLGIHARLQFVYELLAPATDGDRHVFELRRARLRFAGNVFGPDTLYGLHLGFAPAELQRGPVTVGSSTTQTDVLQGGPVLDAYVTFAQLRDLRVTVGQTKVPWSRQRKTSGTELLTVERPLADQTFHLGRDIGVDLHSLDLLGAGLVRYHAGIYAGEGQNPSAATIGAGDRGFLYNARLELMPLGLFDTDSELDLARSRRVQLKLGVAYALLQADATSPLAARYLQAPLGGAGSAALVDFNAHNFTADAMLAWQGLSAFATFHFRSVVGLPAGRGGTGYTLGAGYVLENAPVVLGATYSGVRSPEDSVLDHGDEVMGTLAYLLNDNFLKLHLDYARVWDVSGFSEGVHRLRLQLQALL